MTRLSPKKRKERIIETAYELAKTWGYHKVHAGMIAIELNVSRTLVQHYFSSDQLTEAVIQLGLDRKCVIIATQLIKQQHPKADEMPSNLRKKAVAELFY